MMIRAFFNHVIRVLGLLWHDVRSATRRSWKYLSPPVRWWWRITAKKPLLGVGILLTLVAAALWIWGSTLKALSPQSLLNISAFEIPRGDHLGFTGATLSNMLADDLEEMTQGAQTYGRSSPYRSQTHRTPMKELPKIPVQTTFSSSVEGVSLEDLKAIWHYLRFNEKRVSGDLIVDAQNSVRVRIRMIDDNQAFSWEEPASSINSADIHDAIGKIASKIIMAIEPRVLGMYYLNREGRCGNNKTCKHIEAERAKQVFIVGHYQKLHDMEELRLLAWSLIDLEDYSGAEAVLTHIQHPDARALSLLAVVYEKRNETCKQLEIARQAAKKAEFNEATHYNNLALAYYGRADQGLQCPRETSSVAEDQEHAKRAWNSALQFDSSFAAAWGNLGELYEKMGQHSKAIEAYEKALQAGPDYIIALENLCPILMKQILIRQKEGQSTDEARGRQEIEDEAIFEALVNPQAWQPYFWQGWIYFQESHSNERLKDAAMKAYQQAELRGADKHTRFYLGSLFEQLHDRSNAIEMYLKALEIDPMFPLAQEGVLRVSGFVARKTSREAIPWCTPSRCDDPLEEKKDNPPK